MSQIESIQINMKLNFGNFSNFNKFNNFRNLFARSQFEKDFQAC